MTLIMLMQQTSAQSWTWLVLVAVLLLCCAPMLWMMLRGGHGRGRNHDGTHGRDDEKRS